jgi:hypothetical protein
MANTTKAGPALTLKDAEINAGLTPEFEFWRGREEC